MGLLGEGCEVLVRYFGRTPIMTPLVADSTLPIGPMVFTDFHLKFASKLAHCKKGTGKLVTPCK